MSAPPPIGFMVWNPARGMPTVVHATIEVALAEAERLTTANPGERFIIMSPVMAGSDAYAAKAWSDGKAEGLAEAGRDVMAAERRSDQWSERAMKLERLQATLVRFLDSHRAFRAIVADCLLWFDGFAAAHAGRDDYSPPRIPDRDQIRQLNKALLDLERSGHGRDLNDEIPF